MHKLNDLYIDYSDDPTLEICLNCTRANCNGDCQRVRDILREAHEAELAAIRARNDPALELATKYRRSINRVRDLLREGMTSEDVAAYFESLKPTKQPLKLSSKVLTRLALTYGVDRETIRYHAKHGRNEADIVAYYEAKRSLSA